MNYDYQLLSEKKKDKLNVKISHIFHLFVNQTVYTSRYAGEWWDNTILSSLLDLAIHYSWNVTLFIDEMACAYDA
jgi:hypothetical protein